MYDHMGVAYMTNDISIQIYWYQIQEKHNKMIFFILNWGLRY